MGACAHCLMVKDPDTGEIRCPLLRRWITVAECDSTREGGRE